MYFCYNVSLSFCQNQQPHYSQNVRRILNSSVWILYSLKVHLDFHTFFFLTELLQNERKLLIKITCTEPAFKIFWNAKGFICEELIWVKLMWCLLLFPAVKTQVKMIRAYLLQAIGCNICSWSVFKYIHYFTMMLQNTQDYTTCW